MTDVNDNRPGLETQKESGQGELRSRLLASVMENMPDAITIFSGEGRVLFTNARARELYPYYSDNTTVHDVHRGVTCCSLDNVEIPDERLPSRRVLTGEVIRNERIIIKRGSSTSVIEVNATPIFDDDRRLTAAVVSHHDITLLYESESRFRLATEKTGIAIYTYDFALGKAYWSDQYKQFLGLPADGPEVTGDLVLGTMHPDDRVRFEAAVGMTNSPVYRSAMELDYRVVRPDQSIRWLRIRGKTDFSDDGLDAKPIMAAGTVIDLTEKKLAADDIRRVSEELTHIIESTDDIIFSIGQEHTIMFCNAAAKNHFLKYYGCELIQGRKVTEILSEEDSQDLGELVHTAVKVGKLHVDLRTKRGGRVISYSVNPVFLSGAPVEVTIFGKDITERLHSEREIISLNAALEKIIAERTQQLRQSETNFRNITLALSRDLKSTVQSMESYIGEIEEHRDIARNAAKIKMLSRATVLMLGGLVQYEKSLRAEVIKEEVNIKKLIISVWSELNSAAPVPGTLEFETGLPPVMADKTELRHVLFHIISNALKFSQPDDAPKLVVGCRAEKGAYVCYFRDNGLGFDKAHAKRVFEVFERLHPGDGYEGSGVGLAIVKNIVSKHGGKVWIESEEGLGATVFVSLPMS